MYISQIHQNIGIFIRYSRILLYFSGTAKCWYISLIHQNIAIFLRYSRILLHFSDTAEYSYISLIQQSIAIFVWYNRTLLIYISLIYQNIAIFLWHIGHCCFLGWIRDDLVGRLNTPCINWNLQRWTKRVVASQLEVGWGSLSVIKSNWVEKNRFVNHCQLPQIPSLLNTKKVADFWNR